METGRAAVRRNNGLGFLAPGNQYGGDYFYDDFGNYYEWDWFSPNINGGGWDWFFDGGGGGSDLPYYPIDLDYSSYWADPGISAGNPFEDAGDTLRLWWEGFLPSINTYEEGNLPRGYGPVPLPDLQSYRDIWPWLDDRGPGPALFDPSGDQRPLPGYCPKGTYHPQNDPYACVPFPPDDPNAKKRADQQRKAQQSAMAAARRAQQQQDRQCPKDPQGRPVWRNPQTGKCELVPQCPQGTKFDSTTRRCLTPAQAKEAYGDNNWLLWLLIAAGVVVIATRDGGGSGGRRR